MKIRRSRPEADFTIIPNSALRDDRLSYCARGVLAELLSRPNGWETNADALSDRARRHRGDVVGEGRRGLRSAFKELEAAGYMLRRKEQGERGRFITVLEVYDTPQDRGTARGASASATSAEGTSATGTSSVSTDLGSTDQEEAGEEHPASLALAREGLAGQQDRRAELDRMYAAANQLDDGRLRRLLLQFEQKRPRVYRECRQAAIGQLQREDPALLKGQHSVREIDLLSYKYALQHYAKGGPPAWLVRFPLRSVA
ncbi:hypothetical protein [Streptomyces sp. NBC_01794]|uniref:hypothetical protein n=1 Tax=Streptomyces sp. NBC_01794 TaxID=2975942 RepID=UPI0030895073|nr:hypothetical protein OIE54_12135 [Streptomyces sp. NBC_01794]